MLCKRTMEKDVEETVSCRVLMRTCSPRGKAAMPGQKMSEKWWRRTRRLRSRVGAISFRRSYSRGTCNAAHQRDELEKEMGLIEVKIFVAEKRLSAAFVP